MDSPLLTPKQVQRLLNTSLSTVYKLADTGELRSVKWEIPSGNGKRPKRTTRFKKSDIIEFIEKHYR